MSNVDKRAESIRFYPDRQHCKLECPYLRLSHSFAHCVLTSKPIGLSWMQGRVLRDKTCKQLLA